VTSQNNSKLFWDNTNFLLGLGTATPSYALELVPPATRAFVKLKAFQTADFVAIDIYNTANTAICAFAYGGSTCSVADLQNRQYTWNNGIDAMFYDGSASQTRMILKATSGNVGVGNNTSPTAFFTVTQPVITTGSPNMYQFTGGAHTTLTASTEAIDGYYKLDRSVQFNTGALTTQRAMYISAPTYRFVGSSTITNAATLAIGNAPQQGTNATITNAYALWVQAGTSLFGSNVVISGSNSTPESLTLQKGNNGSDVTIQWNNTSAVAKAWVGVIGTATDFVNEGIADDFFIRAQSNLLFTTNTSGVERMRITSDGALQVRASTAAVSTSSTGSVRYNSTAQRLQISENAGAYASLPSTPVSANDTQLTTTSPTVVATFTPATSGNYIVYVYYRVVTASTDITVNLSWTDGSGSNSVDLVPITTQPVGTYIPEQTYINSTASAITVTVTAGTANQVFVSSNIMRL
jgi:hypothetical protein